jgi:hypothetical protein
MIGLAALLDRLRCCPTDAHRQRLLAAAAHPARALLLGEIKVRPIPAAVLRDLAAARTDPVLFALSQEFLGDFTETLALIWPARRSNAAPPSLTEIIAALDNTPRAGLGDLLGGWLDAAEPGTRYALLRLVSGKVRPVPAVAAPVVGVGGQVTAMLLYAQAQRIGLERVYSFGVWNGAALVPIARIAAGIAPGDQAVLEAWVRDHVVAKFGPVREVAAGLVAELAFDAVAASARHKSGIALHGVRLVRLRPDLATTDRLDMLSICQESLPVRHPAKPLANRLASDNLPPNTSPQE